MSKIKRIRGMNDILPVQTPVWQYLEKSVSQTLKRYGYHEIRMPIVEQTDLFKRSIGEVTDIVEKEMYTFEDRNGESLTLRPEGTASCVRAASENGLLFNQTAKLWYTGPMFRYERPQKGRYRQFHQIGVECFGLNGPDIDAELILLTARLWKQLGIAEHVTLQLNSLGSNAAREEYKLALVAYLSQYKNDLDEDSQRRLDTNPLRILDSKNEQTQAILQDAPLFNDFLDEDSKDHFQGLRNILDANGISYEVNPKLVRGLDYYNKTVFEWVTSSLGAQGTVCAGGRYDGLVEQLGGKSTPGVGFAMGVERLILMLETLAVVPESVNNQADIYIVNAGERANVHAFLLAEQIRDAMPAAVVMVNNGGGSFKSQFKKADNNGASFALIIGDNEVENNVVGVKDLRGTEGQNEISNDELLSYLADRL